ncbi:hypothetical protein Nepgr_015232 [Nepenthes gracilis]|uniref:Regulatory particle non-ATPase 13 n=1 Tax=Nepenthes gracilis TaxID=150966 RepID=A0AAD3SN95_NEPGR|nr:hypothetical protein Nepgr_015232 [Nepenthes gracilis]
MESISETSNGLQEIMLEFRAGKMFLEGKHVIPDTRKGLIRIAKGEEGLIHFMWLDRMQNVVEDDQIIFPDEAVFEKVDQTSGRVYILKFSTDDRKFFFWMQEPKADDDLHLCLSVNYYINRPLEFLPDEEPEASAAVQSLEDMVEEDISSRAGNLVGPSLGAEVTSDVSSSPGPVKMADLQRILSSIGSADTADDAADSDGGLGLGDLLKPDLILPLLETLPIEERLSPYLPEGQRTLDDLMELLQSPPFRQQVDSFTYVLRTGQIDLSQFGIEPSKYKLSVLSFLEALEDSVSTSENVDTRTQSRGCNEPMDEGQ